MDCASSRAAGRREAGADEQDGASRGGRTLHLGTGALAAPPLALADVPFAGGAAASAVRRFVSRADGYEWTLCLDGAYRLGRVGPAPAADAAPRVAACFASRVDGYEWTLGADGAYRLGSVAPAAGSDSCASSPAGRSLSPPPP